MAFAPAKYLIPCVNYNGNPDCKPNTPMGLSRDGEAWTFAYDRTGIPACTLTEDRHFGAALSLVMMVLVLISMWLFRRHDGSSAEGGLLL